MWTIKYTKCLHLKSGNQLLKYWEKWKVLEDGVSLFESKSPTLDHLKFDFKWMSPLVQEILAIFDSI